MRFQKRAFICFLSLILLMSMPVNAFAASHNIYNAFSATDDELIDEIIPAYGWNEDLFTSSEIEFELETDENGRVYIVWTRRTGYQTEFLNDNINTTRQYLGLTPLSDPSAGGGGDIVSVALAEAQNTSRNRESPMGSNNVLYNTEFYGHQVSGDSFPWCAVFVWWCAKQCGYTEATIGEDGTEKPPLFKTTASSTTQYEHLCKDTNYGAPYAVMNYSFAGRGGTYTAYPGDIILFKNMNEGREFCHIGIVVDCDDTALTTVEGNSGDKVSLHRYTADHVNGYPELKYGKIVNVSYPVQANNTDEQRAYTYLTNPQYGLGLTPTVASAILSNLEYDSELNADSYSNGQPFNSVNSVMWDAGTPYGLMRWADYILTTAEYINDGYNASGFYYTVNGTEYCSPIALNSTDRTPITGVSSGYAGTFYVLDVSGGYDNIMQDLSDSLPYSLGARTSGYAYLTNRYRTNLVNYCKYQGLDFTSLSGQLAYLKEYISHEKPFLLAQLTAFPSDATGIKQANDLWIQQMETNIGATERQARFNKAYDIFIKYTTEREVDTNIGNIESDETTKID